MKYEITSVRAGWLASKKDNIRKIIALENELLKLEQIDIPPEHVFGTGFYARTIKVPKGGCLTGKIHLTEHIFMLSAGEMTVFTEDGPKHIKAPYQAVCKPGTKRAGYAHEDCICTNVHITGETDIEKLEVELVCNDLLMLGV